ncbi:hypothetical protein BKA69DRAFT_369429 [Paraphysoderma sedebokerense]|nr:hypothetical protein BKA69DRAFT_369429 [Paraphysoderma sedebokerense]
MNWSEACGYFIENAYRRLYVSFENSRPSIHSIYHNSTSVDTLQVIVNVHEANRNRPHTLTGIPSPL